MPVFLACGIFLVTNYHSMMITRVIPMYVAKIDYRWIHIPIAITGNLIGGIFTAFIISYARIAGTIKETLTRVVEIKIQDGLLSMLIMSIFCGILVAYSTLTSRKYKKGSIAQLFYTAFFIVAFVICGFDHVVANGFYFAAQSFINGFDIQMLTNIVIVLFGNILRRSICWYH